MIIILDYFDFIFVPHVPRINKYEFFFPIPDVSGYAITNYGRVFEQNFGGAWSEVKPKDGLVDIIYDGEFLYELKTLPIETLMSNVFFDGAEVINLNKKNDLPFDIKNIVLKDDPHPNRLVWYGFNPSRDWLNKAYNGMVERATNKNFKRRFPHYAKTTMSKSWLLHGDRCKRHLLSISYSYPEHLEVDKDLMSFGEINEYKEGNICLLPQYLNNMCTSRKSEYGYGISKKKLSDEAFKYIFTSYIADTTSGRATRTFNTHEEALIAARKERYQILKDAVDYERDEGYIPSYILERLEALAEGTLDGSIKLREPTDEVIARERGC